MTLFDFSAYAHYLNAFMPLLSPAPTKSAMLSQINRIMQMSALARQIKIMTYSMFSDIPLDGQTMLHLSDEEIASFIDATDARKLAALRVAKIGPPAPVEIMNSEQDLANATAAARMYGADDSTERVVLYGLKGSWFWGGVHLLKFGAYWRIDSLNSAYANTSSLGDVRRTTPEDFDLMING